MQTHSNILELRRHSTSLMDRCIDHCLDSFVACTKALTHRAAYGDELDSEHVKLLSSCAILCEGNAKLMLADSSYHEESCRLTAKVARECQEMCETMGEEDPMLQECALLCKACAESCEAMSAH